MGLASRLLTYSAAGSLPGTTRDGTTPGEGEQHDLLGYAIDLDVSYRVAIDAAAELPMIMEEETWHDATSCGGEA